MNKKKKIQKECPVCKKKFLVHSSLNRVKFCSYKCYWKELSKIKKGIPPKNVKQWSEAGKKTRFKKGKHPKNEWKKGDKTSITPKNLIKQEKIAGRKKPEQCEICGAMGRIHFDHDHETGEFRGWICLRCNLVLGQVKDNSELLIKLAKYLKYDKQI